MSKFAQNDYLKQYQSAPAGEPSANAEQEDDEPAADEDAIELEFDEADFSPANNTPPPSKTRADSRSGGGAGIVKAPTVVVMKEEEGDSPAQASTFDTTTATTGAVRGGGGGARAGGGGMMLPRREEEPEDEWSAVNRQTEADQERAKNEDPGITLAKPITFIEAFTELWSDKKYESQWKQYENSDRFNRVHASVSTGGFWGCLWSCAHSEIAENSLPYEERDFILCLMQTPLDRSCSIHHRALVSLFRKAAKPKRSDPDPPTVGAHWERELGFQGDNPGTDLRTQGVFGLLQMLAIFDSAPLFADKLLAASHNALAAFPLSLTSLFFSGISIEAMQKRLLHDAINKRAKANATALKESAAAEAESSGGGSGAFGGAYGSAQMDKMWNRVAVADVMNDFHIGCLYHFYNEWTKESVRDAHAFPQMKNQIKNYCMSHIAEMMKNSVTAKNRSTWTGGKKAAAKKKEEAAMFSNLEGDKNAGF